ncbi:hypothetical protein [Paractinoplanes lichenicola]|uniref:Uncharacterized protein n=1 Tax=Paractinoplanes lichenicola TaxID=2802976 RepID=A0ABS1VF81_9ACTN|nr:hypothetical protein [Actinoplanes lichenicola]MBL7253280.1 hypothetical protein [Actinoplanes lichenicola]
MQSNPEPIQPVRPRKAKTAAGLVGGFGLLGLLLSLVLFADVLDSHGASVPAIVFLLYLAQLGLSATQLACGVFIWLGRSWARSTAVGISVINIIGAVVLLFTGAILPAIVGAAVNGGLIRLLTDDDVKDWCDE